MGLVLVQNSEPSRSNFKINDDCRMPASNIININIIAQKLLRVLVLLDHCIRTEQNRTENTRLASGGRVRVGPKVAISLARSTDRPTDELIINTMKLRTICVVSLLRCIQFS
jgi:hypothetical protein